VAFLAQSNTGDQSAKSSADNNNLVTLQISLEGIVDSPVPFLIQFLFSDVLQT